MPYYEIYTMDTRNNGVWYYQPDYKSILRISYRNNKRNNDSKNAFKIKIFFSISFQQRSGTSKSESQPTNTGINQKNF